MPVYTCTTAQGTLSSEVKAALAARISGLDERRVLVVFEDSPASSAVEGGIPLPEPGQESEWLRAVEARGD